MRGRLDIRTVATVLAFLIIAYSVGYVMVQMGAFAVKSTQEQCNMIEESVNKALLQCYALEGSYPSHLEYLEQHYGIMLDRDNFVYQYSVLAANLRPHFEVTPRKVAK